MGLLGRRRSRPGTLRSASSADREHLAQFVRSRAGVAAYLAPRTTVTETTLVLVATTGEWTRRRIQGGDAAVSFARKHNLPLYDATKIGYPQRMREWTAAQKNTDPGRP